MSVRDEMEFAYLGEITTPSRCGRMDQGCVYGNRPIMMIFDGDHIDVQELKVPRKLYFVIIDLGADKDTQAILGQLNVCYPLAQDKSGRNVQKYLGSINKKITREAFEALQQGDAVGVGKLMIQAQAEFDRYLQPVCPSQLTAPVLHQVLDYERIQPYILGGKGVGSQGDGCAQFIVKDAQNQQMVIEIVERDLKKDCLRLVIPVRPTDTCHQEEER